MSGFGVSILPSWHVDRDQLIGFEGGVFVHPLMVAQLDAIRVGSWQRPDVDVWLEGMVAAVGEQAARRAAGFNVRMRFEELRRQDPEGVRIAKLMGVPDRLAHLVGTTPGGVSYWNAATRAAADAEEAAAAWRTAFDSFPRVRVRVRDRARWWLQRRLGIPSPSGRGFTGSRVEFDEVLKMRDAERGRAEFRREHLGIWSAS